MKILFLLFHGFSKDSGISKKIHYQVKGLIDNGHIVYTCHYEKLSNGIRVRMIDNKVIQNFGNGYIANIKNKNSYDKILDFVKKNNIEFIYCRYFHNANPLTVKLFREFKSLGLKSVIEIPTYPYDKEYSGFNWMERFKLCIDKLYRKNLAQHISAFITFTNDKTIFGQRTIMISNGIDFDSIPLKKTSCHKLDEFHFIGVAEIHYWHGYDRMIRGIGEYKIKEPNVKIYFHIVGGIGPEIKTTIHSTGFKELINQFGLSENIIFHGKMYGKELDDLFDKCDFGVGSLARHRCGIYDIKPLKNREYAARGIPFIYSEDDSDFEDMPYIIKAPADESAIDICKILRYYKQIDLTSENIRASIKNLSWKLQMRTVLNQVNLIK